MKLSQIWAAVFVVLAIGAATANAVDPIFYFDVNDTADGSGIDNDQIYTWDAGTTLNWNPALAGTPDAAVAWTNGKDAVFSAGSDFAGDRFGVNIVAGTTANSALLRAGTHMLVTAGALNTGAGNFTVGEGVGQGAIFEVGDNPTTKLNGAGKIILNGGTYKLTTNQTVAHSFLALAKSLEINGEGTIDHQEIGTNKIAIYGGAAPGPGVILGTGGTTSNGGAGTLIITGATGEIRYQGVGLPNSTYAKLKVSGPMLFRLGSNSSIADERGFGAAPLAPLADAITIDGGAIGTSFGVTLHANRGITLGAGGGWFNNSASTMTVPSIVTGVGSLNKDIDPLLVKGSATAAGRLNLTSATGNTYAGGSNINAGTVFVSNTSGSGTGSGPVNLGGSSTTQFGTLMGTGSVSGLTTVNAFGEIRPGGTLSTDNAGTLTLSGGLTLNGTAPTSAALLTFQLGSTGNDKINIGGVNGLNIAGNTTLAVLANGTFGAGTYTLLDYDTSFAGSLSNIVMGTAPAGFTYGLVNNTTNTTIDLSVVAPGVPGDYNSNGIVDGADYVVWRKGIAPLPNEVAGVTPGTTTPEDYTAWRERFGNITGSGSALGGSSAVPEPSAIALMLLGVAAFATGRRGRSV